MTSDQYYEMCEMMGSEPIDSEIPVELGDFPELIQTAFTVYRLLQDNWDSVGGNYLGKNLVIFTDICKLYHVETEEQKYILDIIILMDNLRSEQVIERRKQEESLQNTKSPH